MGGKSRKTPRMSRELLRKLEERKKKGKK